MEAKAALCLREAEFLSASAISFIGLGDQAAENASSRGRWRRSGSCRLPYPLAISVI
ncbi:hypothetical protein DSM21852_08880 [Methylocystis bryophila]|nr:hypothetical protein DSM21852_08880 [Methylocystis bryophila]